MKKTEELLREVIEWQRKYEVALDEQIRILRMCIDTEEKLKDTNAAIKRILLQPGCNDCERAKNKECGFVPKPGENIRINCPLHVAKEGKVKQSDC